ncbi:hypothetical protein HDZ31DRAFT_20160, partial [Schizophyllum fasciatum]
PPRSHHILGFLITRQVAGPFCKAICPLPEEPTNADKNGHYAGIKFYLPAALSRKHKIVSNEGEQVYIDSERMRTCFAVVLADNRSARGKNGVYPPPQ